MAQRLITHVHAVAIAAKFGARTRRIAVVLPACLVIQEPSMNAQSRCCRWPRQNAPRVDVVVQPQKLRRLPIGSKVLGSSLGRRLGLSLLEPKYEDR